MLICVVSVFYYYWAKKNQLKIEKLNLLKPKTNVSHKRVHETLKYRCIWYIYNDMIILLIYIIYIIYVNVYDNTT